jgi:hypothetical protein
MTTWVGSCQFQNVAAKCCSHWETKKLGSTEKQLVLLNMSSDKKFLAILRKNFITLDGV